MMYDDFDTQIQCEEISRFQPTPSDFDEEDLLDTQELDAINDDEDDILEDSGLGVLIDSSGITAEGYNYLHKLDTNGYFV